MYRKQISGYLGMGDRSRKGERDYQEALKSPGVIYMFIIFNVLVASQAYT